MVRRAATESAANYLTGQNAVRPAIQVGEWMSPTSHVMATKEPMVIMDIVEGELVDPESRLMAQNQGFHGAALVPLLADDRSLGVLAVLDKNIRSFSDDEVSLLSAFADQAALALEKARLLNEAQREKERSDALYRVSNLLAGAHNTDEVLDLIVNEAARLVSVPFMLVRLVEGGVLVTRAATESAAAYAAEAPSRNVELGTSATGHTMSIKEPIHGEELVASETIQRLRRYGLDVLRITFPGKLSSVLTLVSLIAK